MVFDALCHPDSAALCQQVIETEVLKDSEVAKIATPEFVKEAWVLTDILRLQQVSC